MSSAISRRAVLTHGVAGAIALACRWRDAAAAVSWRGYDAAIVIDGLGGPGSLSADPSAPFAAAHMKDVRDSGLTCAHTTVGVVGTTSPDAAYVEVVRNILWYEREIARNPETLMRVRTVADIAQAKRNSRTGIVYGFQDGVMFETDLSRLRDFHSLGVRVIQPTYNRRNLLGDGCLEPANAGLSKAGVEAVEQMNELGILVDLSHCGRKTAADAIRVSKRPVAFTHTGSAAIADHPRNRTDEELRAVADKGGVSGIYFMPYLCDGRQPTSADIIRHLEHMIDVAGEDHISIGTDGNISAQLLDQAYKDAFAKTSRERKAAGIAAPGETEDGYLFASDLNMPRRFEVLAGMLIERGHRARRIEKILGGNLMRVFGETWKA
jgi:membrane dipeptidase